MDSTLLYYAIGLLAIGVLVWFRTRGQVTSVYDAFDQFQDALDTAPQVVAAVEQLWQTGALPDKDDRLDAAMQRLGEWFPALTENQLRTAIEAAVWMAKQGVSVIEINGGEDDGELEPAGNPRWN